MRRGSTAARQLRRAAGEEEEILAGTAVEGEKHRRRPQQPVLDAPRLDGREAVPQNVGIEHQPRDTALALSLAMVVA